MIAAEERLLVVAAAAALAMAACRRDAGGGSTLDDGDAGAWTTQAYAGTIGSHGHALAWNGVRAVSVNGASGRWSSTDFQVWLQGDPFSGFNDVAWDGRSFVAVGGGLNVAVSGDGLSWARNMGSVTPSLTAVASSGSTWVAVGTEGTLLHASAADASKWTAVAPPPTEKDLSAVTWTGDRFVAVGQAGTVLTSQDGLAWTQQTAATTSDLRSVAAASAASIVALTADLPSKLLKSTDGTTWTPVFTPSGGTFTRVSFLHGQYLAMGTYVAASSSDGSTWNGTGTALGFLDAAIHDGSRYVAVGMDLNGIPTVFTSTDGLAWSPLAMGTGLSAIARAPSGGRMVATGGGKFSQTALDGGPWAHGSLPQPVAGGADSFYDMLWVPALDAFGALVKAGANQALYQSTDGTTWTRIGDAPCFSSIAASDSTIVNVGASLTGWCLATSTTGTAWTERAVPNGKGLSKAFWTGGVFVAVGPAGAIATAPADGSSWTARDSGVGEALNGAAGSESRLIVVGNGGTILSSADGAATWSPQASGTSKALFRVIWTGGEFVAVGADATLLRSSDGANWRLQATPYTPGDFTYPLDFNDVSWSPTTHLLTVVGSNGFRATLP